MIPCKYGYPLPKHDDVISRRHPEVPEFMPERKELEVLLFYVIIIV